MLQLLYTGQRAARFLLILPAVLSTTQPPLLPSSLSSLRLRVAVEATHISHLLYNTPREGIPEVWLIIVFIAEFVGVAIVDPFIADHGDKLPIVRQATGLEVFYDLTGTSTCYGISVTAKRYRAC